MKKVNLFISLIICMLFSANAFADDHAITGKILSDKSQPIEGAVVSLLSLPDSVFVANAVTDSLGTFNLAQDIKAQKGGLLVVSCIGYERKEMNVTGEKSLLITLKETSHQLKGVTVIPLQRSAQVFAFGKCLKIFWLIISHFQLRSQLLF